MPRRGRASAQPLDARPHCPQLFFWGARTLFVGQALGLSAHRNAVAVHCAGIDAPFEIALDPRQPATGYIACRTALIPANTLHYFGQNPFAGDHTGKQAALATLAKFAERTNRRLLSIVDVIAGPKRAAIIARESFERGGRTAEFERVLVYAIRNEKLHECWVYDGDRALVDLFLADAMPSG